MTRSISIGGGAPAAGRERDGAPPVWYLSLAQMRAFEEALQTGNYYELDRFFAWIEEVCRSKSAQFCRVCLEQTAVLILRQLAMGAREAGAAFAQCLQILAVQLGRERPQELAARLGDCGRNAAMELAEREGAAPEERTMQERIVRLVSRQYSNPALNLTAAARELGMAPAVLGKYTQQATGMRFPEYLNAVRIGKAKYLLACTERRVADIAADCGFSGSRYFSSVFKSATGTTPLQYRGRARGGPGETGTTARTGRE